mmetsp:Transcript_125438/g.349076  ORF Transcript_125438/g.349076 Transcript_125438/m.349076 type:complete len:208 (-) Transcript_125438:58-681(-)
MVAAEAREANVLPPPQRALRGRRPAPAPPPGAPMEPSPAAPMPPPAARPPSVAQRRRTPPPRGCRRRPPSRQRPSLDRPRPQCHMRRTARLPAHWPAPPPNLGGRAASGPVRNDRARARWHPGVRAARARTPGVRTPARAAAPTAVPPPAATTGSRGRRARRRKGRPLAGRGGTAPQRGRGRRAAASWSRRVRAARGSPERSPSLWP